MSVVSTSSPPPHHQPDPWGPPTTPVGVPAIAAPQFAGPRPAHPTLPLGLGFGALVVLTLSLLLSKYILSLVVDLGWPVVAYVGLVALIGYGPSLAWWWFATKRWDAGSPVDAVGARPRWADLGWGPVIWFATLCTQVFVGVFVLLFDVPLANNTDGVGELSADRTYTIAIVLTAVVAAPIVEELVFRGLVMRSLLSKLPVVVSILLQGVLFGVAHVDPVRGTGNVGLALILSGVGISLGGGAYLLRRIGPTMVAHAIFNGLVMLLILTGVRDRLLENNEDLFDDSLVEQIAVVDQTNVTEPHRSRDTH